MGQWVELDLGESFEITRIEIEQGLQKTDPKLGDLFCRNNRLEAVSVWLDDGTTGQIDRGFPPSALTLEVLKFYRGFANTPGNVVKTAARRLRFVVEQVLEPVDWDDLAVAEVRVFGRPVAAPPADPAGIAWDRPGSWPFRAAVIDFCAVDAATRGARRCDTLMSIVRQNNHGVARLAPLPPVDPGAVQRGEWQLFFGQDPSFRLDFRKAPKDEHWTIARSAITNTDGSPAERAWESWFSPDNEGDNPCWAKLGKKRETEE